MEKCAFCGGPCGPDKRGRLRKFCSRVCTGRACTGSPSQGKLRTVLCPACGKSVTRYNIGKGFCSIKCSSKGHGMYGRTHVDKNQNEIIKAFEQCGCSVLNCARIGSGFPDLVVGFQGNNYLVEVKNPANSYGKKGLNSNQIEWANNWPSPVLVARTLDDVVRFVTMWNRCPNPTKEEALAILATL